MVSLALDGAFCHWPSWSAVTASSTAVNAAPQVTVGCLPDPCEPPQRPGEVGQVGGWVGLSQLAANADGLLGSFQRLFPPTRQ